MSGKIPTMSDARKRATVIYAAMKKQWRQSHALCEVCKTRWERRNWATDVHHRRGKAGTLLIDQRYWVPICRPCHDWIDQNRAEARERGWLYDWGLWNSPPTDKITEQLKTMLAEAAGKQRIKDAKAQWDRGGDAKDYELK